ncbi:MAG: autotransporter-associated beta strand repeat-containing protein [Opitutae bacterium]|nr:autotransporter-associated beta strand repeat-containing protein [Opitutae bacterium]
MRKTRLLISTLVAASAAMTIPALAASDLTWNGDTTGTWNTSTDNTVWTNDGSDAAFQTDDNVTFSTGTSAVTLGESIDAGIITITGGSANTLTLNTAPDGNGGYYELNASSISYGDNGSYSNAITINIGENLAVNVSGDFTRAHDALSLNIASGASLSVGGTMSINGGTTQSVTGEGTLTAAVLDLYPSGGSNTASYSITIDVGNLVVSDTLYVTDTEYDSIILGSDTVERNYTIGKIVTTNDNGTMGVSGTFRIGSATTVTTEVLNLAARMNDLEIDGTLNADSITYSTTYPGTIGGAGSLNAGSLADSSTGALEISVKSLNITGQAYFSTTGAVTISSEKAVIGEIKTAGNKTFTIAEDANVTAGAFTRNETGVLNLVVNGTLNVAQQSTAEGGTSTGLLVLGDSTGGNFTSDQTISGTGTLNAYGISYQSGGANVVVSVSNLNIGEGGITKGDSNGNFEFTGDTIVGLYNATSATISTNMWLNSSSGTTFNTNSGETMTLSGEITGSGALVKTGEGTLVISGGVESGYAGGTTISAGTVIATNSNALGQSTVTIDGGQLEISGTDVEVTNAITVVLDSYVVATTEIALADADVDTTSSYAIVLSDGASYTGEISVVAGDSLASILADGEDHTFDIISGYYNSDLIDYSGLLEAGYNVSFTDGIITISSAPEPSMFGLLAGLGALGLVATRRRRNRKA